MTFKSYFLIPTLVPLLFLPALALQRSDTEPAQQEEAADYYSKWLKQDVRYIITDEEKSVFAQLTTPEEKEQFIEQFWFRRDPDPLTAENEFKEEHYRRITFANEQFRSGKPGWLTDRGRIYIVHGPPADIESYPSGGSYERPVSEGGGITSTFPFEVWRYRYIEGLGPDIMLEFVDPSFSGEYRLALNPEEKDALLHVPGAGLLLSEQAGMTKKTDRPFFSPGNRQHLMLDRLSRDNPFARYERYALIQAPTEIKYKDLKELVKVDVAFPALQVETHADYFRLNEGQALVPVTLQYPNRELTFEEEAGIYTAQVAVYGIVTSLSNRIVAEFEDELLTFYPSQNIDSGLLESSIYQKILALDLSSRYKLDLIIKDVKGGKVGVVRKALIPPSFDRGGLETSSLILSNYIQTLPEVPEGFEMFVLGDVKVRPNIRREFVSGSRLGIYFQAYDFTVDQATLAPSLRIVFSVFRKGELVSQNVDEAGESLQFYTGQRAVIVKALSLGGLEPGKYQLTVEITDQLKDQSASLEEDFVVLEPGQLARK